MLDWDHWHLDLYWKILQHCWRLLFKREWNFTLKRCKLLFIAVENHDISGARTFDNTWCKVWVYDRSALYWMHACLLNCTIWVDATRHWFIERLSLGLWYRTCLAKSYGFSISRPIWCLGCICFIVEGGCIRLVKRPAWESEVWSFMSGRGATNVVICLSTWS